MENIFEAGWIGNGTQIEKKYGEKKNQECEEPVRNWYLEGN